MGLSFTVGGTRGTFEDRLATEVAGVLDNAFGAEGDWEGLPPRHFGELIDNGWADLQARAVAELGPESIPNLLALGDEGRGVYLPTHLRAVSLPLSAGSLRCASLPGLRRELAELAERWDLATDDESLHDLLRTTVPSPTPPRCSLSPGSPSPPTRPSVATARSGSSVDRRMPERSESVTREIRKAVTARGAALKPSRGGVHPSRNSDRAYALVTCGPSSDAWDLPATRRLRARSPSGRCRPATPGPCKGSNRGRHRTRSRCLQPGYCRP
jgi:hypothetical protein